MKFVFRPKLLDTLPGYDGAQFGRDASAGLTVGVLALPLAMAFAIASGMSPTAGIWTAIVAGFLISALGGSRVQIGGQFAPTVRRTQGEISVRVPGSSGGGMVRVLDEGRTANCGNMTVIGR